MERRSFLQAIAAMPAISVARAALADETGPVPIRINIPGPHLMPYVPVELIPLLGIDRALGAQLAIRYLPSGVLALEDVVAGNGHFAGVGFTVMPTFVAKGKPVMAIATLSSGTPPYAVLIRNDLARQIRSVRDLKGRSIGIPMGSTTTKTYLQMLMELWLDAYGVKSNQVRWVATNQNYDGMFGALASQTVDAVFCEEPLSGSLTRKGVGKPLASLSDPKNPIRIVGPRHLRAVIASTPGLTEANPQRAALMARMLKRALHWMRSNSPEEVIRKLDIADAELAQDMVDAMRRTPGMFSPDGDFPASEIESTRLFMKAAGMELPSGGNIRNLIDERWIRRGL
jgi:NitT/TauT family transport system substrate-binding protein